MTVLTLRGKNINWSKPPAPTTKVMWSNKTMYGKAVYGSLRTIAHLDRLNKLAIKRFGRGIVVIQSAYNTTVAASAGTHDFDACLDLYIPGVDWYVQQKFFRRNGFGCWVRKPPKFGWHIHGLSLPVPEGKYRADDYSAAGYKVGVFVPGQLIDYYAEAFGLAGMHTPGSDKTWFPEDKDATVFDLARYVKNQKRLQDKARRAA